MAKGCLLGLGCGLAVFLAEGGGSSYVLRK